MLNQQKQILFENSILKIYTVNANFNIFKKRFKKHDGNGIWILELILKGVLAYTTLLDVLSTFLWPFKQLPLGSCFRYVFKLEKTCFSLHYKHPETLFIQNLSSLSVQ